jgi:hypothetical protein
MVISKYAYLNKAIKPTKLNPTVMENPECAMD